MTRPVHHTVTLDPTDGGFFVHVNCIVCGGGVIPEAGSKGREDIPRCAEVRHVVYCAKCRLQGIVDVSFKVVTQYRNGARIG